jgi:hypothetical protein
MADLPAFAGAATTQQQHHQQQQLLRQPWQFQDYVPADLAKQLLPALKRQRGVTVHTPELSTSKYISTLLHVCLLACLFACLLFFLLGCCSQSRHATHDWHNAPRVSHAALFAMESWRVISWLVVLQLACSLHVFCIWGGFHHLDGDWTQIKQLLSRNACA